MSLVEIKTDPFEFHILYPYKIKKVFTNVMLSKSFFEIHYWSEEIEWIDHAALQIILKAANKMGFFAMSASTLLGIFMLSLGFLVENKRDSLNSLMKSNAAIPP